ncbi:MAG TPA: AMP-binding protein [Jatrophihabitantaceae bacterium]|nr:AMP-binding protein [Jatrophihabitantaceae bacterium]
MLKTVAGARLRLARARWALSGARILQGAGLLRLAHPVATLRDGQELRRWGPLAGTVRIAARRWPDALGVVDDRGALTLGELDGRSNALAWAWRGQGVRQDSAVGVLCRNHRGLLDAVVAAGKLGAQVVLLDTGLGASELVEAVHHEGVTALVYDDDFAHLIRALPDRVSRFVAWVGDGHDAVTLDELIAAAPPHELPQPAEPGGLVMLAPARRGVSRGVPWRADPAHVAARFLDRVPLRSGDATLVAAPLWHVAGLLPCVVALALGAPVVLCRHAEPAAIQEALARHGCTVLAARPQQLPVLTGAVRAVLSCGAPDPAVAAGFGDVLYAWYGTPASPVLAVATPEDWQAAPGTVGRAVFGCRLAVLGPDGRPAGTGQVGRVHVVDLLEGAEVRSSGHLGRVDASGRLVLVE